MVHHASVRVQQLTSFYRIASDGALPYLSGTVNIDEIECDNSDHGCIDENRSPSIISNAHVIAAYSRGFESALSWRFNAIVT